MYINKLKVLNGPNSFNKLAGQCFCYCTQKKDEKSLTAVQKSQSVTKSDMQWRTPWHEKKGEWYSLLKAFSSEHNQTSVLKFIQTPVDLRPSTLKKWWLKKQENVEIAHQAYLAERNEILGNELAAAHFVVHRGGAVKFYGEDEWIKRDELENYSLPMHYNSDKVLQCIDCYEMRLYYEGLANFRNLRQLEWLSLNGCKFMDDWCMDRVSNVLRKSLLYLDIRGCPSITDRGLGALWKMEKLQTLLLDNKTISKEIEMMCLMLQELYPKLDIKIS